MNAEQIVLMEAGPALDEAVAARYFSFSSAPASPFSTYLLDAWRVFEAALVTHGMAAIDADMEDYGRGAFFGDGPERVVTVTVGRYSSTGPVCEAICKAALLAAWAPA